VTVSAVYFVDNEEGLRCELVAPSVEAFHLGTSCSPNQHLSHLRHCLCNERVYATLPANCISTQDTDGHADLFADGMQWFISA